MKKTVKELRAKNISQLQSERQGLHEEIAKLALEFKASLPKDTNSIAKKKKRLAIVSTLLKEKRDLEEVSKKK